MNQTFETAAGKITFTEYRTEYSFGEWVTIIETHINGSFVGLAQGRNFDTAKVSAWTKFCKQNNMNIKTGKYN